jgi:uroporphyrinogen-III decarboxylase
MECVLKQWQPRIQRAEAQLTETFRFQNKRPAVVVVDANYWTFGDRPDEIPDDYYTDPAAALRCQLAKIDGHYENIPDDDYIPFLHPWFGTGVLASAFGIKLISNPKMDPAVDIAHMQMPEEIDALRMPAPGASGAMADVVRCIDYFRQHADLPVVFTDCQGPMATALQIVGYDKFCYWVQDDPERIHKLMALVTDALIAWVKFQKARSGQPLTGCSFPLSIKLPEGFGGVWLSDDDSVILSAGLYHEFIKPYNERFLAEFGGGCIHYCGNSTQNIENYCNTRGVTAINNFALDDLAAAAKIRRALRDKGIVYMACDFTPADDRLDDYYHELTKAMDGAEGLVVASYIAPAIALNKGKYDAASRDRAVLARRVSDCIGTNWGKS